MGMSSGCDTGLQSEINVTPLVDVVLVLLIIFMVVIPLTLRGYDVDMPATSTATTPVEAPSEQIVLQIEAEGCPILAPPGAAGLPDGCSVRVNDETVGVAMLSSRIAEIFAPRAATDRVLFLSVQKQLNYEGVMRIVDVAKGGVDGLRIGFVARTS